MDYFVLDSLSSFLSRQPIQTIPSKITKNPNTHKVNSILPYYNHLNTPLLEHAHNAIGTTKKVSTPDHRKSKHSNKHIIQRYLNNKQNMPIKKVVSSAKHISVQVRRWLQR